MLAARTAQNESTSPDSGRTSPASCPPAPRPGLVTARSPRRHRRPPLPWILQQASRDIILLFSHTEQSAFLSWTFPSTCKQADVSPACKQQKTKPWPCLRPPVRHLQARALDRVASRRLRSSPCTASYVTVVWLLCPSLPKMAAEDLRGQVQGHLPPRLTRPAPAPASSFSGSSSPGPSLDHSWKVTVCRGSASRLPSHHPSLFLKAADPPRRD